MKYLFGIDGGGTSARLRIETLNGDLLFHAVGGSTNPHSNTLQAVETVLSDLFTKAYKSADLDPEDCVAGYAGSAGIDRPCEKELFITLLRKAGGFSCPVAAGNDVEPALAGALGDTEGFLLISGTGSIAYARSRSGVSARAGGWGHLLGDEGSAYRIAFDALTRGLRSWENRDLPSGLLDAGLAFFGLREPSDLVSFVYGGIDKARIARFAHVVGEYRDRGDLLAVELFEIAGRELENLVLSVDRRMGDRIRDKRLALCGGFIEEDTILRDRVSDRLHASAPGIAIVPAQADAATGACLLARTLVS
ncbi:MAG: BadF/BadG/BcrA/BcrD ATPase family protein [Rectinemataceae bacterium]